MLWHCAIWRWALAPWRRERSCLLPNQSRTSSSGCPHQLQGMLDSQKRYPCRKERSRRSCGISKPTRGIQSWASSEKSASHHSPAGYPESSPPRVAGLIWWSVPELGYQDCVRSLCLCTTLCKRWGCRPSRCVVGRLAHRDEVSLMSPVQPGLCSGPRWRLPGTGRMGARARELGS